jgi:hypothetical protein
LGVLLSDSTVDAGVASFCFLLVVTAAAPAVAALAAAEEEAVPTLPPEIEDRSVVESCSSGLEASSFRSASFSSDEGCFATTPFSLVSTVIRVGGRRFCLLLILLLLTSAVEPSILLATVEQMIKG